jgi:hypothetical protein
MDPVSSKAGLAAANRSLTGNRVGKAAKRRR